MRKLFAALVTLLLLTVFVQFFLAAMGAFDTAPKDESFQPHRALGYGMLLLAVVLTLFAAVVRLPGRLIGLTGLAGGLVLLQAVIAGIASAFDQAGDTSSTAGKLVFGLHAINGLIIFGVVEETNRQARDLAWPRTPSATDSGSADRTSEATT